LIKQERNPFGDLEECSDWIADPLTGTYAYDPELTIIRPGAANPSRNRQQAT
jgi:hypothetical protein